MYVRQAIWSKLPLCVKAKLADNSCSNTDIRAGVSQAVGLQSGTVSIGQGICPLLCVQEMRRTTQKQQPSFARIRQGNEMLTPRNQNTRESAKCSTNKALHEWYFQGGCLAIKVRPETQRRWCLFCSGSNSNWPDTAPGKPILLFHYTGQQAVGN